MFFCCSYYSYQRRTQEKNTDVDVSKEEQDFTVALGDPCLHVTGGISVEIRRRDRRHFMISLVLAISLR